MEEDRSLRGQNFAIFHTSSIWSMCVCVYMYMYKIVGIGGSRRAGLDIEGPTLPLQVPIRFPFPRAAPVSDQE